MILRVLEWLQASRLRRSRGSPPDPASPVLRKPSWVSSGGRSSNKPAGFCLRATNVPWCRASGAPSGIGRLVSWGGNVTSWPTTEPGRGERRCFAVGGGGGGGARWGGRRARNPTPARDRRLRDWGLRLPTGRRRGLRAGGGKRWGKPDVQRCRQGLLLRTPAGDLQAEGVQLWAAMPVRQHQHWRPHGVIHSINNQQTNAASSFTQGHNYRHRHWRRGNGYALFLWTNICEMMMLTNQFWLLFRIDTITMWARHGFFPILLLAGGCSKRSASLSGIFLPSVRRENVTEWWKRKEAAILDWRQNWPFLSPSSAALLSRFCSKTLVGQNISALPSQLRFEACCKTRQNNVSLISPKTEHVWGKNKHFQQSAWSCKN